MPNDQRALPDEASLLEAAKITVLDSQGEGVEFGSILANKPTIVVFIRHFFCGPSTLQEYVAQVSSVRPDALANAGKQVVIVGCGSYEPIAAYKSITTCPFPIYADPSRALYHALGMTIETLAATPANEPRKSYLQTGNLVNALQSIWRGPLKNPSLIGKQGNISQLGGEFVFEPGPMCTFASRMQHTQDHVEVAELMEAAGVEYP
ncbi:AhpC/TSA antioxidant enzyme-domain-containing protein [Melanogaster broomeanus]|nr:AhpC/TSA antioxidant enzyme-domain-containing protein [Melanogaster broomeanus]